MKVISLLMVVILIGAQSISEPEDKVVFLDVGALLGTSLTASQGDAILLQNGTRQVLTCWTQNRVPKCSIQYG